MKPDSRQYATFQVAGHELGIDVLEVQEVLRGQLVAPVPLASPEVAGLINLRGQIVPALETGLLLNFDWVERKAEALSVVVKSEDGAVSLQVDEMGDVIELERGALEAPPRNVDARLRKYLSGVHPLPDRLLLLLDVARVLEAYEPQT